MDASPRASVRLRRGDKELTFNIEDMLVSDCGFCTTIDIYGMVVLFVEFIYKISAWSIGHAFRLKLIRPR